MGWGIVGSCQLKNKIMHRMKKIITLALAALCHFAIGQERIDVAEQTIKIGSKEEEVLFYGFAEGDQIVFNFEEVDEKEVKEIEIIELPVNSKFQDYEAKSIKDKIIKVNKKGVYKFRFYNSAMMKGRVCRIKIQRIPKSPETLNFNTGIKWVEKFDTTYDVKTETVTTGYNTIAKQKTRRVLATVDTGIVQILDRVERVHSTTNVNSNVQLVTFQLPEDSYSPHIFKPYKATETVSWAYAISVGESGKVWYKDANSKAAAKSASKLAVSSGMISTGYGALALLAIEGLSAFSSPPQGDNIRFQIYKGQYPIAHSGNSVVATGRELGEKQGSYTIRLENDNIMDGINVDIKVVAVIVTKTWKDEEYTETEQEPIKEKKIYKLPKVAKTKVPVLDEN